jgi:hypothetical protein
VKKKEDRVLSLFFALIHLVIDKMIDEKSKYCMDLLKNAGVNNPEKYIRIFDSLQLTDKLGAIEFVRNVDGSIKKLRFGFFKNEYFSNIDNESDY